MIKLLIVDDEQIEREGLQVILQKAYPELDIKQAKNGKIAVQMAQKFQPDLILMDIKMPGMNGLEALELINSNDPLIKFIMVTAYDTFEYMRSAIKFGVKDYLLKPSKVSDIIATVGKVLKEIEEDKKSLETNRVQQEAMQKTLAVVETDVVTQLLFDHVHEVHLDLLVDMLDIQSMNEMFVMTVLLPSGSKDLYSAVKNKVRKTKSGWVGALNGNQLPIIVFRDSQKTFRSQGVFLAREILSVAKSGLQEGWFIGIGNVCSSLEQIRQSYQDSLIAIMDSTLPVKYRFYGDVPVLGDTFEGKLMTQREKEISEEVRLGNWKQVHTILMNLIQHYENERISLLQTQQRILEIFWITSRVMSDMGLEVQTPFYSFQTQDYRQLRTETGLLLDKLRKSYLDHYDQLEADTIHQIKQYITEHSHEDISLEALAGKVNLSPIYISKMFKEKLGINYIDFLTEYRIEKAKKLMADPDKSIKEITFEVGYHEPNYFSKVFKKICSMSPKEYRKKLLGKKA